MAQTFRKTGIPQAKKQGYWGHVVVVILVLAVIVGAVALYTEVAMDVPAGTAVPEVVQLSADPPNPNPGQPSVQQPGALPQPRDLHTPVFSRESCAALQNILTDKKAAAFKDINAFLVGTGIERDLVWRALHSAAACYAFNQEDYSYCTGLDNAFPERRGGRMNCGSMVRSIAAVAISLKRHLGVQEAIWLVETHGGAFSPAERSIVEAFTADDPKACDTVLGYRFGRQLPANCRAVVSRDTSLCQGQEPLDELRCTQITRALLDMKNDTAPAVATGNLFDDIAYLLAGNQVDCMSYARNSAARLCEAYAADKTNGQPEPVLPTAE